MEVLAVFMMKRSGALALAVVLACVAFAPVAVAQKAPDANAKPAAKAKAPSPCKGLEQGACTKMGETCSWIDATTRKDGKQVKAYCRKKAGFAAKTTKAAPVKKAAVPKKAAPAKAAAPAAEPAKPAEPAKKTAEKKTTKKVAKPPAAAAN